MGICKIQHSMIGLIIAERETRTGPLVSTPVDRPLAKYATSVQCRSPFVTVTLNIIRQSIVSRR
jgi:hypothetical protein